MASKHLFEYAILIDEKKDKGGEIKEPAAILVEPTFVLARDVNEVNIVASRAIPPEQVDNLDRITIAVRPF
jgi:hypothetical protein